jgi:WD40 repeat protein
MEWKAIPALEVPLTMGRFTMAIALAVLSLACEGCGPGASDPDELRTLSGHSGYLCSVAFRPDGKQLASGGADGTIRFWDVASGECQRTLDGHAEWVHSVAFSPDGRFLASGGRDALVKLWDVSSGKQLKAFAADSELVKSVAYSPDGRLLASCGRDKVIRVWDIASGDALKTLGTDDFFTSSVVAFSSDSKQVFFGGDSLQLWDIDTGQCLRTFAGHSDSVGAIALSHNGKWIASAGNYTDHTIRVWDIASGKALWKEEFTENEGAWSLVFAAEDAILVSGHFGGTIRYWDVKSKKALRTIQAHSQVVSALSADRSGHYLASGSWDKSIKLWKAPGEKLIIPEAGAPPRPGG